jgi:hypothetical protein
MGVSGELYTPAALCEGMNSGFYRIGSGACSSDDLNDMERIEVFTIARFRSLAYPAPTSCLETIINTDIFLNFTSIP